MSTMLFLLQMHDINHCSNSHSNNIENHYHAFRLIMCWVYAGQVLSLQSSPF